MLTHKAMCALAEGAVGNSISYPLPDSRCHAVLSTEWGLEGSVYLRLEVLDQFSGNSVSNHVHHAASWEAMQDYLRDPGSEAGVGMITKRLHKRVEKNQTAARYISTDD